MPFYDPQSSLVEVRKPKSTAPAAAAIEENRGKFNHEDDFAESANP